MFFPIGNLIPTHIQNSAHILYVVKLEKFHFELRSRKLQNKVDALAINLLILGKYF